MATTADDVAPWLLRNNDVDTTTTTTTVVTADPLGFPSEFPYELGISLPVESVAGSTETEINDDEEDFFAALTRRLSHPSLHHSRKHNALTSRVPSPFTAPFCENNDPREALYAAVARLKYLNSETSSFGFHNRGFSLPHVSTSFLNQKSEDHVWGKNQVQQQQQLQILNRGYASVKCTRHVGSAVRRNSGGTGVFLPRHHVKNPMDLSHKKSGFAPVLVPAKVVHALNVTNQSQFSNAFAIDYDALLARRNALLMHQLREEVASYESRLPKDWTY